MLDQRAVGAGTPEPVRRGLYWWLKPSFDETTLFLMAVTFILLLVTPSGLPRDLRGMLDPYAPAPLLALPAWAALGLVLSLYHAFTNRKKDLFAKTSMAVFAMVTNVGAGWAVGFARFAGNIQGGQFLAAVNVAGALLLLYEVAYFQDQCVLDDDARPRDLLVGVVVLLPLFVYFEFVRRLPWPLTFSICTAYATLLHQKAVAVTRAAVGSYSGQGSA